MGIHISYMCVQLSDVIAVNYAKLMQCAGCLIDLYAISTCLFSIYWFRCDKINSENWSAKIFFLYGLFRFSIVHLYSTTLRQGQRWNHFLAHYPTLIHPIMFPAIYIYIYCILHSAHSKNTFYMNSTHTHTLWPRNLIHIKNLRFARATRSIARIADIQ